MLFTRWITVYWVGLYAKVKHDMVFTKVFVLELIATISVSIVLVPTFSDPRFADWINSGPTIGWALVLIYWVLTMVYYSLPLFQAGGQEVVRIQSRHNFSNPQLD